MTNLEWGKYEVGIAKSGHEPAMATVELSPTSPRATVRLDLKPLANVGATAREIYEEKELGVALKMASGTPVVFPPNVAGPAPGQALSVEVAFIVNEDGSVTEVQVQQSGGTALDAAVTRAVSTWKFTPGTKDGVKVKTLLRRKFTFKSG